jgi:membrane-associated protein
MSFDPGQLIQTFGYLGIFAIVLAETGLLIGFALPGDTLLIVAGITAAAGKLSLGWVLLALYTGAVIGHNLGFWWGRVLGPRLENRVKKEDLERARALIKRFGIAALLIGPYVPVVRTLIPFVLGASGMPWPRYLAISLLGCAIWTQGLTVFAYFVGSKIPHLERYIYIILLIGMGVAIVPALLKWWQSRQIAGRS